jgi:predicted nucleic acid-binding protein
MSWLVDTNVISELSRRAPNPKVSSWLLANQDELHVSVLTLGELEKGLSRVADKARRQRLERWVRSDVPTWFGNRVLEIDVKVAVRWGRLVGSLTDPLPAIDSLIAATALEHRLTVVSRNKSDFSRAGIAVLDPWT